MFTSNSAQFIDLIEQGVIQLCNHFTMTCLGLLEIWEGSVPPRCHLPERDPDEQGWLTMRSVSRTSTNTSFHDVIVIESRVEGLGELTVAAARVEFFILTVLSAPSGHG